MRILHLAAVAAMGLALGAMPGAAKADWLGLADGTYDVTLTCTISSAISCPTQIQGTVTIEGAGASFLSYTVDGEVFSGDPADSIFQNAIAHFQISQLYNSPFSFADLRFDLTIPNPQIPDDHWWVHCPNSGVDVCTPTSAGTWTAIAAAVPAPFTLALFTAGLAGLGLRRRH
jgi:hypothetical protein